MSLPTWTWKEGHLPIGVQLVAAPGREDLLRVAAQLSGTVDNPDTWDLCRECQPRYVTPLPRRE